MITTLFLLQLIGFQLWHISSKQVRHSNPPAYLLHILDHSSRYRMTGSLLFLISTVLFIWKWGWMTGICASVVGIMAVGSLVVALQPFGYISQKTVLLLYAFFLILEIFI